MFGVDSTELIIVAVAALLFIGPKELPATMRAVGQWVGKIRATARHFSSGIETMIREAELEEMERKWREENERIMQLYPSAELDSQAVMVPQPATATDEPELPLAPELPLPPSDEGDRRPLP